MLTSGWNKHFIDGHKEVGTDDLIRKGLASWRRGRLSGICAVDIQENGYTYILLNPLANEWWQGDRHHARYMGSGNADGKVVSRFVQYKIESHHIGRYLTILETIPDKEFKIFMTDDPKGQILIRLIQPEYINKWITMEIRPGERLPRFSLREHRG